MQLSDGDGGGGSDSKEIEHEHNHDGPGEKEKTDKDPKTREYEAKELEAEKYPEKDNACHLRATGDKESSELNDRASNKDNELDSLLGDNRKESSIQDKRNELDFNVDKENPNYEKQLDSVRELLSLPVSR